MTTASKVKELVAIYARKSRKGEQGVEEALYNQKETLIKLAEQKGYDYEIFQEVKSSLDRNRPELNKMLRGIENNKYKRILVTNQDRLSRDVGHSSEINETCLRHNVLIETPNGITDLSDSSQRLILRVNQVFSNHEYDTIKERLTWGKFNKVANKKTWVGSRPPLGYFWDRNTKKLTIIPEEKEIVRKMVDLALQGYSSAVIADKLNKLGYKGKRGGTFKTDRILEVLKNRVYLGEVSVNSKALKKKAVAKNCHEAIITEDEFNQIQALFKSRRSKENLYSLGLKSCLNKLLVCGVCGKGLTIQKSNKANKKSLFQIRPCVHYLDHDRLIKCYNRGIKIETVEDAVKERLMSYRGELKVALKKLMAQDTTDLEMKISESIKNISSEICRKEKQNKKLLDLYLDDAIDKQDYQERKNSLETDIKELKEELSYTENKLAQMDVTTQTNQLEKVLSLIDNFDEMEMQEQNATLKLIIQKIVFTKSPETDNKPIVDIHWREL